MKKYIILALSVLALASCVRDLRPETAPAEEGLVERTWTVAMDDGTRATLDGRLHPVWEVGDKLSVYDPVLGTGRVFIVESVDGNKATITGTISAGDFPFDAIYPSASAGAWSSDGTNTLKLPETQVIPAGRDVCPTVLVSTAHCDSPDGVIAFHNLSSLLKVQVARDGISEIRLSLTGASASEVRSYKAAAETGKIFTVEEATVLGGLGSAVAETVTENQPVPVFRIGVYDAFGESGPWAELMKKYKLDTEGIYGQIKEKL